MIWRTSQFLCLLLAFVFFSANTALALGTNPVISHTKTGETGALSREYIAIYNNSDKDVDITNWCVYYASASDATKTKLKCLEPSAQNIKIIVSAFGYVRFSSVEFKDTVVGFVPDGLFIAGMSSTGGHIRLQNSNAEEIDKVGWGTAISPETSVVAPHQSGSLFSRKNIVNTQFLQDINNNFIDFSGQVLTTIPVSGLYEEEILVDVCGNLGGTQIVIPDDYFLQNSDCLQDICDNLDGLQTAVPSGHESLDGENCYEIQIILESSILQITELLPNSISTDTGKEFIEIYNPNSRSVNLKGYKLELGTDSTKKFIFGDELFAPFSYKYFSDDTTKITLPNSSSFLRLFAPNGDLVSETEAYNSPNDDESWALINSVWQFSNVLTPGSTNVVSSVETSSEGEEVDSCPAGKYRNPETNRCKNIEVDQELNPCPVGQERNIETNRCRLTTSSSNLVPCKEGQERNPETNRCRNIINTASNLLACDEGQERNPETNRCRKIPTSGEVASANVVDVPSTEKSTSSLALVALIVFGVLGYAVYEWRSEMSRFYQKALARFKN